MKWNQDITPVGWFIVSVILIIDGLRVLIGGKIYGKVRTSATVPLEGWYVHVIGGIELAIGSYLCYRLLRKWRDD